MDKLQAEILKAQDSLQDIAFSINKVPFKFYYRYLTLLEKVRIEQVSIKRFTKIDETGNTTVTNVKQDYLIPINTILEKSLDINGKRLFSSTDPKDFKTISSLPAGIASYIAYKMSDDIFGTMGIENDK